jgi:hypothetical protein
VVVVGIIATGEVIRLVRGHRHCERFGGCAVSVFVRVGAPVRA